MQIYPRLGQLLVSIELFNTFPNLTCPATFYFDSMCKLNNLNHKMHPLIFQDEIEREKFIT